MKNQDKTIVYGLLAGAIGGAVLFWFSRRTRVIPEIKPGVVRWMLP